MKARPRGQRAPFSKNHNAQYPVYLAQTRDLRVSHISLEEHCTPWNVGMAVLLIVTSMRPDELVFSLPIQFSIL
jgi:hypothetical protein